MHCVDVMVTLLRDGLVRNGRDTNKYIFEMYIIKSFTTND